MNNGLQGGDNREERGYWRDVIAHLPGKSLRCLDLGAGVNFTFEKTLLEIPGGGTA